MSPYYLRHWTAAVVEQPEQAFRICRSFNIDYSDKQCRGRPLPAAAVTSRCVRPVAGVVVKSLLRNARQTAKRMAPRVQPPASLLVQHDVPASTSVPRLTIFARAFHVYLLFRSAGGVVVTGLLADPDRVLWFAAEIPRDFVCSYLIWSPCCDLEGWEARWLASWLLLWFGTWERLARGGTHVKRRRGRALPVGAPPLAHVLLGHVMSNPLPFPPGNGHCASVPSFPALCCGQVTVARQPWSGGDTSAHNVSLSLRRSSIS